MKLAEIGASSKYSLNGGPFGSKLVTNDYVSEGVPVIRGSNLSGDSRFSFDDLVFVSEEKADELRPNNAHPGDIIFTQRGTVGQVGMIPAESPFGRFVISQSQMKLTVDRAKADPVYVYQYFKMPSTVQRLINLSFSSGVPHINLQILREFELDLPPLTFQRRIASILSTYDDLIDNNLRRIKILEEMAQSLYREWFVDFRFPGRETIRMVDSPLGMIPEGWEASTVGEGAKLVSRGISPHYGDQGPVAVVNQRCIRNRQVSLADSRLHSGSFPAHKQVLFGDVLINSTGVGTLGRTAQIYKDMVSCVVDSHVTIVRPAETIDMDYFGMAVMALESHFELQGTGATGQTELGRDSIRDTLLLLPPRSIQESFSTLVQPARRLCLILLEHNEYLRTARDLLLPKLISGELDVSDLDIDVGEDAA